MGEPSAFGGRLKRLRQDQGLTQDELAELVGCATQTIRKIEGGQRRPSYQMAERLALVLALAPDERAAWMRAARETAEQQPATPTSDVSQVAQATSLPTYLTPFVGRERERADLARLLSAPGCRLVTVLGPGGIGKTRLVAEVARGCASFPDGVGFVSLAPVAAPAAIVPAIGEALGFAFAGPSDLEAQLAGYLADKGLLLVLDNLEHLLDEAGLTLGLLGRLLAQAPGLTLLVTSRVRVRLPGEWVIELAGLATPPAGARGRSGDYPALALFLEHAQRSQQSFQLGPENYEAVARICRLVDGMPLALELAAAWVRMLSLEEIGQELGRGLGHLSPGTLPARHHSLEAVVDHSWSLLSAAERQALRRLSVLQGGFRREAAAQVAEASLAVLVALADKSLLRRAADGRYDLHELIRQYAAARLEEDPAECAAAHARHAAYFAAWLAAREAPLKRAQMAATLAELSAEVDNLRAAWRWSLAHGRAAEVLRGAEALHWFYEFRGWFQEGAAAFLEAAQALRPRRGAPLDAGQACDLGRILAHYGYLASRLGMFEPARAALAESLALLRDGDQPEALSHALMYQGMVAFQMGDYAQARRDLNEGLALGRAASDPWTIAFCEAWGSMVAHALGQYAEAEALFRSSLAAYRALGNPRCIVFCVTFCSVTLVALGKHREAQALLREGLMLSQPTDDPWGMALLLQHLGLVALGQSDAEEAAYLFREALALLRATGNRWEVARALNHLGVALLSLGATPAAGKAHAEALAMALEAQATPEALQALAGLAAQHEREGRLASALGLAERVLVEPALRSETREQAQRLVAALRPRLAPEQIAAAEDWAGEVALIAVAEEVTR